MNEGNDAIRRQWDDLVRFAREGTRVLPDGFAHDVVDDAYLRVLLSILWRAQETPELDEQLRRYQTLYSTDKKELGAVHAHYRRMQALYHRTDALTTQLCKGEITDRRTLLLALCDLIGLQRGEEGGTTAGVIFGHAARVLLETRTHASGDAKKEIPKQKATPTLEEVEAYMRACCDQKGAAYNATEAEKCFDHFEANGWKQANGNRIVNWKAAVRNWLRRVPEFQKAKKQQSVFESDASYDINDFMTRAVGLREENTA